MSGDDLSGTVVRRLDRVRQDFRVGIRSLRKQPGFTLVALLTLAVGMGATVAMFGVLNLALFQALPFPDSDRLVLGRTQWPGGGIGWTVSGPDYFDVREESRSFEALAAVTPWTFGVTVTSGGDAERVVGAMATPGFFGTLGTPPALGREFAPEEGEPGGDAVVVISHELWQRRLGGSPSAVGATLLLGGSPYTVIGVMPAGFRFQTDAEVWLPVVRTQGAATYRQYHNFLVVGRLRRGVTVTEAANEVGLIMTRLAAEYPESNRDKGMVITPMQATMFEGFRPSMLMLMGAVLLVLLISCGNVAGLLLARSSRRRPEMATRAALGAGRGRILGQLLTESAVLAIAAGLLGAVAAFWLQHSIVGVTPLTRLGLENAGTQPAMVAVAVALPLLTVLVFGLGPALVTTRVDLSRDLREGLRTIVSSPSRFRHGIVVSQVALSVVLMVCAMLLVRSFQALRQVDPGFDAQGLLTAEVAVPAGEYEGGAKRIQFFDALVQGTAALPGVRGAALISRLPIRDQGGNLPVWDPARPPVDASEWELAYDRVVTPGYFDVMRIPLRSGRDVQASDTEGSEPVIVINEAMAETLYPGESALGRLVAVDSDGRTVTFRVVGIVGNVRVASLEQTPRMIMYHPYGQRPLTSMRLAVRTPGSPAALVSPVREVLRRLDANIPLALPSSMDQELSRSVSFTMTVTTVLGAFAGVALFLAALGLYGVLAYHVAERRHEIGVRLALGAAARDIMGLVLRRGFSLVGAGILIGLVAALAGARLLDSLLFGVQARDATTFTAVTVFFAVVAFAACLIPAWRAVRVQPVSAFRPGP